MVIIFCFYVEKKKEKNKAREKKDTQVLFCKVSWKSNS